MPYDNNGYWRGKDGKLHHRKVAYQEYLKNKYKYSLPFSSYVVHHIDGNKRNNHPDNLMIITQDSHEKIHGIGNYYLSGKYTDCSSSNPFIRYWLPAVISIAGYANYHLGNSFKYMAWIGTIWFALAWIFKIRCILKSSSS